MTTVTLKGGLLDGQQFEVDAPMPRITAPGRYEDSHAVWRDDHFVRIFPFEHYTRSKDDPSVYVYSRTEPAAAAKEN